MLEYIIRQVQAEGFETVILTRNYGDGLADLYQASETYVCDSDEKLRYQIERLAKCYVRLCFANTVMSGDCVPMLKENGYRVVSLIHELPDAIRSLHAEARAKSAATMADAIVFPSTFVRDRFLSITQIKCASYIYAQGQYLLHGEYPSKEESMKTVEKNLKKSITKPIVLNIATSSYRKGFDLFVDLARQDSKREYIWIGFKRNAFSIKSLLGRRLTNLALIDYISNPDELCSFYAAADVFALTSREEPFGSVVIEAFSVGLPVVAFDQCGGYIDIVKSGETGQLVNAVASDQMLCAIDMLLSQPSLMESMSTNCKATASCMTFQNYVDCLLQCLCSKNGK